jgi:hypothetical protein
VGGGGGSSPGTKEPFLDRRMFVVGGGGRSRSAGGREGSSAGTKDDRRELEGDATGVLFAEVRFRLASIIQAGCLGGGALSGSSISITGVGAGTVASTVTNGVWLARSNAAPRSSTPNESVPIRGRDSASSPASSSSVPLMLFGTTLL